MELDLEIIENNINSSNNLQGLIDIIESLYYYINQDLSNESLFTSKEQSVMALTRCIAKTGQLDLLPSLLPRLAPFFSCLSKSKVAKLVRNMIDEMKKIPNSLDLQISLCQESIKWCKQENRTFLRHRIFTKLVVLLHQKQNYNESLTLLNSLIKEVKKLDDKLLLVEIHLIESDIYLSLSNIPKAKGALTSSRTYASSIYCPPELQTRIDQQAGIISSEEKDFKTAYSYFYEAFEGYNNLHYTEESMLILKYMILCKILDVRSLVISKAVAPQQNSEINAMLSLADYYSQRDLDGFQSILDDNPSLTNDKLIKHHLSQLSNSLLELNIMKVIKPFSTIEIEHLSKLMHRDVAFIENKIREMIIDRKIEAILDQGLGNLIIFQSATPQHFYEQVLSTFKVLNNSVDQLYDKASKLNL